MYTLIIIIPLFSAISAGLFGRLLGGYGAGILTTSSLFVSFILSLFIFYEVGLCDSPCFISWWTFIDSGGLTLSIDFMFDSVTAIMLIVVTSVSTLVHLYSTGYMSDDPHLPRFMSYLSLFTFAMLLLVTAGNLIILFTGWEGVGICSYLLINFWYTRIQANKSAMKAMIVNRVGDLGLLLAMFVCYYTFKSIDFSTMFSLTPYMLNETIDILGYSINSITAISLLLFIGAVGKSAQLGLHTWLPDAMEGPTPVSALIHAATMVTAGVFLLVRCSPIIEYSNIALIVITIIGASTAFFAATVGLVQNDIKKVIAYSTCSQLGYMIFACGLSNYATGLFHLANHAFFKALLFLSAGCVIHAMADEQDMRKLGGLIKAIPFTYSMMLIGSLSLMGFPFLTGFYSKDAILELAYASYSCHGTFAHWLGTLSAFFTAFYSMRLLFLTFITNTNAPQSTFLKAHENPWMMSLPLVILAFGSIFIGYLGRDAIIGAGSDFFAQSIFVHPSHINVLEAEFISPMVKWTPVIFSISGALLASILYYYPQKIFYKNIYTFLNNKWHWDYVYNHYIGKPIMAFGHNVTYKILDRGLIEYIGPTGIVKALKNTTTFISQLQSGMVYNYAFVLFLATTLILITINNKIYIEFLILLPLFSYIVYNQENKL